MKKLQVGDLVKVPILNSINLQGNSMLADTFIPSSYKEEAICEVAAVQDAKKQGPNILVFAPKKTGWNFQDPTNGAETPEMIDSGWSTSTLDRTKIMQHNGWWITSEAVISKASGHW